MNRSEGTIPPPYLVHSVRSNRCRWCAKGTYQPLVIPEHGNYKNYGLGGAQPEKWRLLRCDQCGHVQWFRDP